MKPTSEQIIDVWKELESLPIFLRREYSPSWRTMGFIGRTAPSPHDEIFNSRLYNLISGVSVVVGSKPEMSGTNRVTVATGSLDLVNAEMFGSLYYACEKLDTLEAMHKYLAIQRGLARLLRERFGTTAF